MKKLTKKQLIILISLAVITIVCLLFARNYITKAAEQKQRESKIYEKLEDYETMQDVCFAKQSKYQKQKKSEQEGFVQDVYLIFAHDLYENEKSYQAFFEEFIRISAYVLGYDNFRLIDSEKELVVAVICDKQNKKISAYYINGEVDYFAKRNSENARESYQKGENSNLKIESAVLQNTIQNNWQAKNINFGDKTSTCRKYDIYFEEGIEVRVIARKVFNIVFTQKHTKSVVNGIKPGTPTDEIEEILGTPTFRDQYYPFIGYKTNSFYIFFSDDQISVYPIETNLDLTKILEELEKYNQNTITAGTLISNITDIWEDYNYYEKNENAINLVYALKGVTIQFNISNRQGLTIFNNYQGKISKYNSLQDFLDSKEVFPRMMNYEDQDLVNITEQERFQNSRRRMIETAGIEYEPYEFSNLFVISQNEYGIQVLSIDGQYADSELNVNKIDSRVWYQDKYLIYSISRKRDLCL